MISNQVHMHWFIWIWIALHTHWLKFIHRTKFNSNFYTSISSTNKSSNGCKISEMKTALKACCNDLERDQQVSKIKSFEECEFCSNSTWISSIIIFWNECQISKMMIALKVCCNDLERDLKRDLKRNQQVFKIESCEECEFCSNRAWISSIIISWNECQISKMMTALKASCNDLERDKQAFKSSHAKSVNSAAIEREDLQELSHEMNVRYRRWWLHWKLVAMISNEIWNEIWNEINKFSKSSHAKSANSAAIEREYLQ